MASYWSLALKFGAISVAKNQWTIENCKFVYTTHMFLGSVQFLVLGTSHGDVAAINGELMTRGGRFNVKVRKLHSGGWLPPSEVLICHQLQLQ